MSRVNALHALVFYDYGAWVPYNFYSKCRDAWRIHTAHLVVTESCLSSNSWCHLVTHFIVSQPTRLKVTVIIHFFDSLGLQTK